MDELLERLNQANDVPVTPVSSPEFAPYGRVVEGYDFSEMLAWMESSSEIPEQGNVYRASVAELEATAVAASVERTLYGGMPIEVGYCNGRNTTYNGFEYHKGSEINVAVTDFMLVLGHTWEIANNSYRVEDAHVFFVPRGTAIEMYQTTLHLSPCRVCDEGFKGIVILPRGTNTPLDERGEGGEPGAAVATGAGEAADAAAGAAVAADAAAGAAAAAGASAEPGDPEAQLLLQRNKWVIAHPEREPLIRQGAHPGLIGENKELHY